MKLTYEEFLDKVKHSGKTKFDLHDCSMCGYSCGYIVDGDYVYYDSGCYCTGRQSMGERSFEDFFNALDRQAEEYVDNEGKKFFPYQSLQDKMFG